MQKILHLVLFIPLAFLVAIYTMHSFLGLTGSEEFFEIVSVLGLNESTTSLLVHAVFPLDGIVALLLVFGNKLSTRFPWGCLFLWAGLWPWVPRLLEWYGGLEPELGDAILVSVMAILAYYLYRHKGVTLFKRR